MKKFLLALILLLTVSATVPAQPSIWDRATKNLFRITFNAPDGMSVGTGFCAPGKTSLIITAAHVDDAARITVKDAETLAEHPVVRMGWDAKRDLSTLLLEDDACKMSTLEWGPMPKPGDEVYLVGYHGGMRLPMITKGIVSGLKGTFLEQQENGTPVQLNGMFGASGGPIFNARGQVVGLLNGIYMSGDEMNVGIMVDEIRKFLK